jgi:hypothetical protein
MARTVWAIILSLGCTTFASCAYQQGTQRPFAIQESIVQPTVFTEPLRPQGSRALAGDESDCVLSTGDIHLWCNWISQYY